MRVLRLLLLLAVVLLLQGAYSMTILWTKSYAHTNPYPIDFSIAVCPRGVIVLAPSAASDVLSLFNVTSGAILWTFNRTKEIAGDGRVFTLPNESNRFFIHSDSGHTAFSIETGQFLFSLQGMKNYGVGILALSLSGKVLFTSDVDYVYSFNALTGTRNWAYYVQDFPGDDVESNVAAATCEKDDGTLVDCALLISAASVDDNLGSEVLAVAENAPLFRNLIHEDLSSNNDLSYAQQGDLLLVSTFYGTFATSVKEGRIVWNVSALAPPTLLSNDLFIATSQNNREIFITSAATGAILQSYTAECSAAPAIIDRTTGILVVQLKCPHHNSESVVVLRGVNISTGAAIWSVHSSCGHVTVGPVLNSASVAVFGTSCGLSAVNTLNGNLISSLETSKVVRMSLVSPNVVVVEIDSTIQAVQF